MQVDRKVSMDILRMNVATLAKFALGKVNTKRLAESFDPANDPIVAEYQKRAEDRKKNKTTKSKEDNHTSGS